LSPIPNLPYISNIKSYIYYINKNKYKNYKQKIILYKKLNNKYNVNKNIKYNINFIIHKKYYYDNIWGLGIGDWGLGIGDWAQSPIPNPQSPIPNPHF